MVDVRGSNRAVEEFTREMERAEHELRQAQERVETLRRRAAGTTRTGRVLLPLGVDGRRGVL